MPGGSAVDVNVTTTCHTVEAWPFGVVKNDDDSMAAPFALLGSEFLNEKAAVEMWDLWGGTTATSTTGEYGGARVMAHGAQALRLTLRGVSGSATATSLKTDDAAPNKIMRIFPHRANPWANPHSGRHFVGPPPRSFGNKTQFVSYRGEPWGGTNSNLLDAVQALDLGNAIYPELPFIWQQNATALLRDIRQRGMFLVNLNSYFIGAATDCRKRYPNGGGVCQFRVSSEDMQMLDETMGDYFAGFEIGEKDGGMLGVPAGHTTHGSTGHTHALRSVQLEAAASARRDEWLRFRHNFERMGEDLGF